MNPGIPSIDISFAAPAVFVIILVFGAALLSFVFYRFTLPAVPPGRRFLLSTLRGAALALLLTLFCEPLLRLAFVTRHPPVIAVLADNSQSMTITDRSGDRAGIMRNLLRKEIPSVMPRGVLPLYATFGAVSSPFSSLPPDTLPFNEEVTDIAAALRGLAQERESSNVRAALFLTDGTFTIGENPVHEAGRSGIPIFTVGIGDTSEQKDVLVSRVAANDIVYAGSAVPVDVSIKSSGLSGERVEVTLQEGPRVLDRKPVVLPAGTAETSVTLAYTPGAEGTRRYSVRVSPIAGELTGANNHREFMVRVLKSKLRILIVASGPGADLAVIRQTLSEEKNFTVVTRTQKAASGFYEGTLTEADADSADCLVTIGMPSSSTDAVTIRRLNDIVVRKHTPLLFIGGKGIDHARVAAMAPSLPVTADFPSPMEQEVEFVPEAAQRTNPLLASDPATGIAAWTRMPPVYATQTVYRARDGAVVLGFPRVHNVLLTQPFMATRSLAGTKTLAVLGYGLWRWRLMAQGNPETEGMFSSFLGAAVTWLASRDAGKGVRVRTTKDEFSSGERIEFAAQVYNASAQPVDNAQLRVTVRSGDQTAETELRPIGSGRYQGGIDGLSQGEYNFSAHAASEGAALGDDAGSFTVGGLNLEFLDTRMNEGLLRQLATRTGGRFFAAREAARLRGALDSLSTLGVHEELRTVAFEPARRPEVLGLLILLFAAEWIIRKRSGML